MAKKPSGTGCLVVIVIVIGLIFTLFVWVGATGSSTDAPHGCSKLLPNADFKHCINRTGVWSGISK